MKKGNVVYLSFNRQVDEIKINTECRSCLRLNSNGGQCKGKKGGNPCLAFKSK